MTVFYGTGYDGNYHSRSYYLVERQKSNVQILEARRKRHGAPALCLYDHCLSVTASIAAKRQTQPTTETLMGHAIGKGGGEVEAQFQWGYTKTPKGCDLGAPSPTPTPRPNFFSELLVVDYDSNLSVIENHPCFSNAASVDNYEHIP